MKANWLPSAIVFCMTTATATAQDSPATISRPDFINLSQRCAPSVAPETMAALVKTESDFHTFAIGVNNGPRLGTQPKTKEEAVEKAKGLIADRYSVDLGLAQISSFNLVRVGLSVDDAFDPCKNLAAAAWIMERNYRAAKKQATDDQAALRAALSAYNTGSFSKGFLNGYVRKVRNNAMPDNSVKVMHSEKKQREASAPGKVVTVGLATADDTSASSADVYARSNQTMTVFERANVDVYTRSNQTVMVFDRE